MSAVSAAAAGVAVLAVVIAVGARVGVAYARARANLDAAETLVERRTLRRPEGVRIVHGDGTETLCEPSFERIDQDGIAIWNVLSPFNPGRGDRLRVAVMPGRTALSFRFDDDPDVFDRVQITGKYQEGKR